MKSKRKSKLANQFAEIPEADFKAYIGPRARKLAKARSKALGGKLPTSGKLALLGFVFPPALLFWPWLYRWWAGFWGLLALLVIVTVVDVYLGKKSSHLSSFAGLAFGMQLPAMYMFSVNKAVKKLRNQAHDPAEHGSAGRSAIDWAHLAIAILINLIVLASSAFLILAMINGQKI